MKTNTCSTLKSTQMWHSVPQSLAALPVSSINGQGYASSNERFDISGYQGDNKLH